MVIVHLCSTDTFPCILCRYNSENDKIKIANLEVQTEHMENGQRKDANWTNSTPQPMKQFACAIT